VYRNVSLRLRSRGSAWGTPRRRSHAEAAYNALDNIAEQKTAPPSANVPAEKPIMYSWIDRRIGERVCPISRPEGWDDYHTKDTITPDLNEPPRPEGAPVRARFTTHMHLLRDKRSVKCWKPGVVYARGRRAESVR
jgi:hypothetical protein